jgi:hypothetical protein
MEEEPMRPSNNVLPFRATERSGMGRTKTNNKLLDSAMKSVDGLKWAQRDMTPERKSIVLPAFIWRRLEAEATEEYRTLSKHMEAHYTEYCKPAASEAPDVEQKAS